MSVYMFNFRIPAREVLISVLKIKYRNIIRIVHDLIVRTFGNFRRILHAAFCKKEVFLDIWLNLKQCIIILYFFCFCYDLFFPERTQIPLS